MNPISFFFISLIISERYSDLKIIEEKSKYSLSGSFFDWRGKRALRRPVFKQRDIFLSRISTRFEYIATTDIRSFYHSIPANAVPKSIHASRYKKDNLRLYGVKIETLLRNAQGGQTVGLPVGPDTSRILAEVVAASIDADLENSVSLSELDVSRFVDDYTIGCNSIAEGRRYIAEVRRISAARGLDIGGEKTFIRETDHLEYVGWQENIIKHITKPMSDDDIKVLLYVIRGMNESHKNLNIGNFSMQQCRSIFVRAKDWNFLQEHIIATYRQNSTVIDSMVEIFLLRQKEVGDLDLVVIGDFVSSRLPVLAEEHRTGEIIWLLYMCVSLKVKLKAKSFTAVSQIANSLVALLATSMNSSNLIDGDVDFSIWKGSIIRGGLETGMWLYIYELAMGGIGAAEVEAARKLISGDPFYAVLMSLGVRLFKIGQSDVSLSATLRERMIENKITLLQGGGEATENEYNADISYGGDLVLEEDDVEDGY